MNVNVNHSPRDTCIAIVGMHSLLLLLLAGEKYVHDPRKLPKERPPAPPPAWTDEADSLLLDVWPIFLALFALGAVRLFFSWLLSTNEEQDDSADSDAEDS